MTMTFTRHSARAAFEEAVASAMTPASLERYRLDRLMELRAVIDALRAERGPASPHDPWARQDRRCHS